MAMGKFSEVFPPDQMIQCDCKSWSFFDWGIQVCTQNDFGPSKRNKDMSNVKICTNCLKPVVVYDGTAYDATEYVSKDQVESLLQRGQAREHLTPVKIDPIDDYQGFGQAREHLTSKNCEKSEQG